MGSEMCIRDSHKIMIRFLRKVTVTTKNYLVFRDRVFSIGHVGNVDQVNSIQPLLCAEEKP